MKILFLTSKLGFGHTRAADAIKHALTQRQANVNCRYLDLWSLMDTRVAESVKDGYLRMTREYPGLYQKLYDLDESLWRQLSGEERPDAILVKFLSDQQRRWFPEELNWLPSIGKHPDRALLNSFVRLICANYKRPSRKIVMRSLLLLMRTVLLNRLKERIQSFAPDVIVATQMYPAALLSHLKKRDQFQNIPSVGIVTDYGLQSVWVRPTTDMYCVACADLIEQLSQFGVPEQQIHHTGIPLMPQFKQPPNTVVARRALNLRPDRKTILVTGGQYGIGILDAVKDLVRSDPNYQILVTAGRASAETADLKRLAERYSDQIRVFDWVDDMATLLSAADVVVGKPGGLSVSESLACGRPFFATCSLGGQERHNISFLVRNGVGGAIKPENLAQKLAQVFASPVTVTRLKNRAYAIGHRNGADKVARLIENVYLERKALDRYPRWSK